MQATSSNLSPLRLIAIKSLHTFVWLIFAGSIVALPVVAWQHEFTWALALIILVLLEVVVLAANHLRCPLTAVAARYTSDRSANFDIFLPLWIARYNKEIFGPLFAAGVVFTWFVWRSA